MTSLSTTRSSFLLVALTAFLLVFGSTVRVHGAGLSCPDWPLCFGQVVPAFEFKVYLEFGHRVVAGFVSLGFLMQAWWLRHQGAFRASRGLRWLYPVAAVILAVQVVLGGLTVLELLAEWTVASHLIAGNTFAVALLLIALFVREWQAPAERPGVGQGARWVAVALLVLIPAQIVLGGLVAGSHAGLACGTWPSCNGAGWFPTFSGLVGLQVTHRVMAYTVATLALLNLAVQWRHARLRRPALVLAIVVALQVTVGVANVLLRLPMEVTLLHSAGAAASYLCTAWLVFEAWMAPVADAQAVGPLGQVMEAK